MMLQRVKQILLFGSIFCTAIFIAFNSFFIFTNTNFEVIGKCNYYSVLDCLENKTICKKGVEKVLNASDISTLKSIQVKEMKRDSSMVSSINNGNDNVYKAIDDFCYIIFNETTSNVLVSYSSNNFSGLQFNYKRLYSANKEELTSAFIKIWSD